MLVDNSSANPRVTTDLHAFEENTIGNMRVGIHAHARPQDAVLNPSAANDCTAANDRIDRSTCAFGISLSAKDELARPNRKGLVADRR
jgi:hypothetical protein